MIPASSATSRTTADSADSPASMKPAKQEYRRCQAGLVHATLWPSRHRPPSPERPSCTSTMTAGSVRGHTSRPSSPVRAQPASAIAVGFPSCGEYRCRRCQFASAIAVTSSADSRSLSSCPISRMVTARVPGSSGSGASTAKYGVSSSSSPRKIRSPSGALSGSTSTRPSSLTSAVSRSTTSTRLRGQASASQAPSVRRWAARRSRVHPNGGVGGTIASLRPVMSSACCVPLWTVRRAAPRSARRRRVPPWRPSPARDAGH